MTSEQSPSDALAAAHAETRAYSLALVRTLQAAGVKFLRYMVIDAFNTPRCKAVPIDQLLKSGSSDDADGNESHKSSSSVLLYRVPVAAVCFAGMPSYADFLIPGSGFDARRVLIVQPDIATLRVLPYSPKSALVLGCAYDQETGNVSAVCCRGLLQRIVRQAARDYQIGVNVGVEFEFCLYDSEADKPVDLALFASPTILNRHEDFISALYDQLKQQDLTVEHFHAESASGQLEVVLRYCNDPVKMADTVVMARETIINVARLHGLKALFLPKINAMMAGSGCHIHLSLRDLKTQEPNIFFNKESLKRDRESFMTGSRDDISAQGQAFMEGILSHLPALLALTLPTTNSFRRVGPGCWTGSQVGWGFEDKEASLRVVANFQEQKWEHFEYKLSDSTSNFYLALAGILIAGFDGISKKMTLRPSLEENPDQGKDTFPDSLGESLDCLEQDEVLMAAIPKPLSTGYLAIRRTEVERSSKMTLDEEVKEALDKA